MQILPLSAHEKFPSTDKHRSDMGYIFAHFDQFITSPSEAEQFGYWNNIVDGILIPEIIWPIRHERIIKPLVLREHSCLNRLKEKREQMRSVLQELAKYLNINGNISKNGFSICDITLATAIATLDYLGEISWQNEEIKPLYDWYITVKCRPIFITILKQKCQGISAHSNFAKVDF